jgi:hypothetical protein
LRKRWWQCRKLKIRAHCELYLTRIEIIVCYFDSISINRLSIDRYFLNKIFQTILYDQFHDTTNVLHCHASKSASSHTFQHLHKLITCKHFFCRFSQCINLWWRFLVNIFNFSSRVDHIKKCRKRFLQCWLIFMMRCSTLFIFFNVMLKFFCFITQLVCLFDNMIQSQTL